MYSLLIKNATIIDGTGKPGTRGDVAVEGGQIVNIAASINSAAQTALDASGLVLAPGFIDVQNHSDGYWQIFENPSLDSLTSQGFTTILVGNCGASLAPLLSHKAIRSLQKWRALEGLNINWQSFGEFMATMAASRFACNIASLAGYSTIRQGLVGSDEARPLEKNELAALGGILRECLKEGAFGLSSGLSYAHEVAISEAELLELAKIVKEHGALFSVHLRNEAGEVAEALEEALDIARATEVNMKISHFKVRGQEHWPKLEEALGQLETAVHRGLNVHFDLYPYDITWQALHTYLPKWAVQGGRDGLARNLAAPMQRNKILAFLAGSGVKFADMAVASTANKLNTAGKRIGQIAKNMEVSSEEAVLHLIQNGGSEVMVFERNLDERQVEMLCGHPLSLVGSDGGGFPAGVRDKLVHPRCFGSAAKFLRLCRERNLLPLEAAVKKLTSAPAKKIGLKKRGQIAVGNFADLVLFDPAAVADRATMENPYQYSKGIKAVFVNGQPVFADGSATGKLPGTVLRKTKNKA